MKQLIFSLIACSFSTLFLNCEKKKDQQNEPYIISEVEQRYKADREQPQQPLKPPPPPRAFVYGSNNFVIDKDTNIFYFQRVFFMGCGTGTENDTIPHFANLTKQDFVAIPTNNIAAFVQLNLKKGERNFAHIASQIDTLNFNTYFELIKFLNAASIRADGDMIVIRKTTQEEDTVLAYKRTDKFYDCEEIKWDTTRINISRK